jgi:hypothetical protein
MLPIAAMDRMIFVSLSRVFDSTPFLMYQKNTQNSTRETIDIEALSENSVATLARAWTVRRLATAATGESEFSDRA